MLVYVDDMVLTSKAPDIMDQVVLFLATQFKNQGSWVIEVSSEDRFCQI